MDTSHILQLFHALFNPVIVAVLVILLWKLLPSCFILFMKAYQNLQTLGFKNPTLDQLPLGNIEDEPMEDANDEYEVFLSFRGADTRNNFVSHLYKELKTKGVYTFMDDRELKRGKPLSFLLKVIQKCKIVIVVFSRNYASSDWCLDELVKVVECMNSKKQIILPIFYNLDLDAHAEFYSKALENHQKVFENDKINNWRNALSTVAEIAGWDSRKCENDATLIENVVRDVLERLISKSSSLKTHLIGIGSKIMILDEKLGIGCDDVRMIGIWGPGGVGKTTIADFIYERETSNYDACCRIKNINDKFQKEGAIALQRKLISQILLEKDVPIEDEDVGCDIICRRFKHKKVFIVLDDVNELRQLEVLANDVQWFGHGSRIIITTRDKRLLVQHGVEYIYEVPYLEGNGALHLFSLHAFKKNQAPDDFLELSNKFISYAKGLPLALKILGSSLYKRDKDFWKSELEKLKRIPNVDICQILRTSYDGLEDFIKDAFLDIVFFSNSKPRAQTEKFLDYCGSYPQRVLPILEERALVTISYDDDLLHIHDLIREMAHEIVREEGKDNPNKRSRICHPEDVNYVLTKSKGATSTRGIYLNELELKKSIHLKPNSFTRLDRLKILYFEGGRYCDYKIRLLKEFDSLPNELRYFCWSYFPQKSLPFNSFGEHLIYLELQESELERLWEGKAELGNLKVINLENSVHFEVFPDLSKTPCLEEIFLFGCMLFYEFSSDLSHLNKLKILDVRACESLTKLPMLPMNLVELKLSYSGMEELPSGIQFLTKLKTLLIECWQLTTLPTEIGELESLTEFCMNGSAIEELPQSFSKLKSLGPVLRLKEVAITRLPETIGEMKWLTKLELEDVRITELPESIGGLNSLEELSLYEVPIVELPQSIGHLHKLKVFHLGQCSDLVRLPSCMHKLVSLEEINISECESLNSLPELPPSLESLTVKDCEELKTLERNEWIHFKKLKQLVLVLERGKLDQRSLNDLMEGTRVMVHRNESSDFTDGSKSLKYMFPGEDIPKWFNYTSSEASISVALPSSSHHIRGFAFSFCAAYHKGTGFRFSSEYRCATGSVSLGLMSSVNLRPLWSGRDHVVVWYYHFNDSGKDVLTPYLGCEVHFTISYFFGDDEVIGGEDIKMKKWGVYVIHNEEASALLLE